MFHFLFLSSYHTSEAKFIYLAADANLKLYHA